MSGQDVSRPDVPRVFIGLPVRNGMPTIGAAIESLLTQEFSDFKRELDLTLDPEPPARSSQSTLSWMLSDMWTVGARYGMRIRQRGAILIEIVQSFGAPGTLHDVMLDRNRLALRTAIADRRPLDAAGALAERLALKPLWGRRRDDRRDGLV